jgi:hypothetical protein
MKKNEENVEPVDLEKQYVKFSKMLDNQVWNIFKAHGEIPSGLWEALSKLLASTDSDQDFCSLCPEASELRQVYGWDDARTRAWIVRYYTNLMASYKDSPIDQILDALKPTTTKQPKAEEEKAE